MVFEAMHQEFYDYFNIFYDFLCNKPFDAFFTWRKIIDLLLRQLKLFSFGNQNV